MKEKNVLILGAGRVSQPAVNYLLDQENIRVTVADMNLEAAKAATAYRGRTRALVIDAKNKQDLTELVNGFDAIICLVNGADTQLVEILLAKKDPKPAVFTTDYVKPSLAALKDKVEKNNLYVLTGVGLDPGIDHASIIKMKYDIEKQGGKIKELYSLCGSLPAKENSNSWGMRLGWLPSGIVDSTARETRFIKDGKMIRLDNQHTFEHVWEVVIDGETYEANANDLIDPYLSLYGVEDAHSVIRGTLRYPGWKRTVLALRDLGFYRGKTRASRGQTYDLIQLKEGRPTYRDFLNMLIGKEPAQGESMEDHVARYLGISSHDDIIIRLRDIGLFKDSEILAVPLEKGTPNSVTGSDLLVQLVCSHPDWNYHKGHRDIIVMEHIVIARYPGGVEKELTSTIVLKGEPFQEKVFIEENHREERFGIKVETFADGRRGVYRPGVSAISATVGNTAAAAVVAYLEGETDAVPGLHYGPLTQQTAYSLLKRLDEIGIRLIEKESSYDRNNPRLKPLGAGGLYAAQIRL